MDKKKKTGLDLPAQKKRRILHKIKDAGRPPGSPNKKSKYARTMEFKTRCSEGFKETLQDLAGTGTMSQTDHLHLALQEYAYKRLAAGTLSVTKII